MIREVFEPGFLVGIAIAPGITALLIAEHLCPWENPSRNQLATIGIWVLAGGIAFWLTQQETAIFVASLGLALSFVVKRFLGNYYVPAQILVASALPTLIFGIGWSVSYILSLSVSPLTRVLLFANLAVLLLSTPLGLMTFLPSQSYLLRKRWYRPRQALSPAPRKTYPKVSFHVPCYAEPPEVVCATLNALSRIRYPNFEVILVDNNTKDPALWKPLERHCEQLNTASSGPNFRFFHVDPLAGAKAGALNFALRHTDPEAELIAVVDADYQASPDFLERLVGFFDDPLIGFVQTPHDYRGWQGNFYQRACYWEYMLYFRLQLACLNEWVASYIIGTMCVTRRCALEEAGGWAEWCLTEDSECAVRIHALGYSSIFLTQSFGWGLIPENFRGYKKQRLRWTIGPIQQIWKHWHLYLPDPFATPSKLTLWQRLLELSHSLGGTQPVMTLVFLPLACATLVSTIVHQETIVVPTVLWIAAGAILPAALANVWLMYRLAGCRSVFDMVGATMAALSLVHIRWMGGIMAVFSWRPFKWRRTNKFKVLPNHLQALGSSKVELILALFFLTIGCLLAGRASYAPPDILFLAALGFFSTGAVYLTTPFMALLAEFQLR